jgi:hypothetical protein
MGPASRPSETVETNATLAERRDGVGGVKVYAHKWMSTLIYGNCQPVAVVSR